ncbi:MAG: hypothetical protein COA79_19975 [Planctomycetota bacterium]|nr:MAG: hypothetical protein COA79_19975 [Planctomycetota bacterium]
MSYNYEKTFDIVVAGGGLAGVCAAISSARLLKQKGLTKAKVALINDRPVLGGVSSSEIRVPPVGAGRNPYGYETGIISELLYEERHRNHNRWEMGTANSIWDIVLWEAVKNEQNIELFQNTSVRSADSIEDGNGLKIKKLSMVQLGNESNYEIFSKIFIDCTGDSTLAYEAGAECMEGREEKSKYNEIFGQDKPDDGHMGSSLLFQAKDVGRPCPFKAPEFAAKYESEKSLCFRPHQSFKNGYYWIEVGVPHETIKHNEEIRDELLRHVLGVWDHLKNHCSHFGKEVENWALDWVGMIPGKRGSRRIVGDSIMTENDLRDCKMYDDRVAYGGHFLDLHTMGGILAADKPGNPVDTDPDLWDQCRLKPYPIRLSALYSKNVNNLFMAGRNISSSHVANGSARVMLTTALMGQSVGTAAAICIEKNITPKECRNNYIKDVQQLLLRQGCFIHQLKNEDPEDLVLKAKLSCSGESNLDLTQNASSDNEEYKQLMDKAYGTILPITTNRINSVTLWIENEEESEVTLIVRLKKIKHVWDFQNDEDDICQTEIKVPSKHTGPLEINLNVQVEQNSFYFLYTEALQEIVYLKFRKDHPAGTLSVWQSPTTKSWKYMRHNSVEGFELFCLGIKPEQSPYGIENIRSGVTRPYEETNLWVSSPMLPAHVELNWDDIVEISTIEITFDTDLTFTNETMPAFSVSDKCVKNYEIQYQENNNWHSLIKVEGNYQRQRIHHFPEIKIENIRIIINKTNGDLCARIYEIRLYKN